MNLEQDVCPCGGVMLRPFTARSRCSSSVIICPPCGRAEAMAFAALHPKKDGDYGFREAWEAIFLKLIEEQWFAEERIEYVEFIQIQLHKSLTAQEEKIEAIPDVPRSPETPWSWTKTVD